VPAAAPGRLPTARGHRRSAAPRSARIQGRSATAPSRRAGGPKPRARYRQLRISPSAHPTPSRRARATGCRVFSCRRTCGKLAKVAIDLHDATVPPDRVMQRKGRGPDIGTVGAASFPPAVNEPHDRRRPHGKRRTSPTAVRRSLSLGVAVAHATETIFLGSKVLVKYKGENSRSHSASGQTHGNDRAPTARGK